MITNTIIIAQISLETKGQLMPTDSKIFELVYFILNLILEKENFLAVLVQIVFVCRCKTTGKGYCDF